jgi:hypothetical protein
LPPLEAVLYDAPRSIAAAKEMERLAEHGIIKQPVKILKLETLASLV